MILTIDVISAKNEEFYKWKFSILFLSPRASLIAQLVKNPPAMQETQFDSWVRKIYWRRDRLPTPVVLGLPLWLSWKRIHLQGGRPGFDPWVWSLGWEDPLEKGKATHTSILAWRISWIQSMGSQRVGHDWETFTFLSTKWHSTLLALKCVSICTCVHSHTHQVILHKNLNQQQLSSLAMSAHKQYYLPFLPVFLGQWNQKEIRYRG